MKTKIINILSKLFKSIYIKAASGAVKKVSGISSDLVIKIISKSKYFKFHIKKNIILLFIFAIASSLHPLIAQSINPSQESIPINSINPKISSRSGKNASALFNQGQSFYNTGKFDESVQAWQQASEFYQQQNDAISLSTTLSNLSLAYQALGHWQLAEVSVNRSLQIAKSISPQTDASQREIARALDTKGRLALSVGNPENALDLWKQAAILHNQLGDFSNQIRNTLNQEQALKIQGFYRRSLQTLEDLLPKLQTQPNSLLKAIALSHYGEILSLTGDINLARQKLEESFQILQSLPDSSTNLEINEQKSIVLLNLGNVERVDDNLSLAIDLYNQSIEVGQQPITKLQGKLNLLSLAIESEKLGSALEIRSQIAPKIASLPISDAGIRARINYAESILQLTQLLPKSEHLGLQTDAAQVLAEAVKQSQSIGSQSLLAYSLGGLGNVYEQSQQVNEAIELTERAIAIAQSINAPDIAYRWQWQLGRLLKAKGDRKSAIASYTEAIQNLRQLRSDLAFINSDVQFSFRERVEPVYRQLVSLLLQPDSTNQESDEDKQKNLLKAQAGIESLQLAELVNFFRSDCLNAVQVDINQLDRTAAVIYPILLEDRLEVIISLPQQPLRHYSSKILPQEIDNIVAELRSDLRDTSSQDYLAYSQKLYNFLIRPTERELEQAQVKTIVFVLDGSLRNIPMSVLNDGKHFLVEKYSLALTPGLQLIDPKPIARQKIAALTGGLTEASQGFSALPSVNKELQEVQNQIPSSKLLLNANFTKNNLEKALEGYSTPIIHLATHGNFSSQAENTFLLTYDGKLNIESLTKLLLAKNQLDAEPIELLILSACQTAVGDKRAALGMAGMAVRAGARSTIASLWSVDDEATSQFMISLYKSLSTAKVTKSESLRTAQLNLLNSQKYSHPYFWAAFVLLGNWL
ncbi:CHAT domain-containing protein [Pseudanabaena sp. ABRG5-3]|uniref:CHAT domain-containing protein n=1 Tax=Pseudanabaena sp. ABRG5-3 TaxID=685565 RepID=UPI0013A63457|nr:CHAT domain-containing protein [Pseudanabaena sp. ABRG5-3]